VHDIRVRPRPGPILAVAGSIAIVASLAFVALANPAPKVLDVCGAWFNPATGKCEPLPDPASDPSNWWCLNSPGPVVADPQWAADRIHEHQCTAAEFEAFCAAIAAGASPGDVPPERPPCSSAP
jgi:hypothetical protein